MAYHRTLCLPIRLLIWAAMLITLVSGQNTSHTTLPIYQLHPEPIDENRAIELAKELYGISDFKIEQVDSRIILCSGTHRIEVDPVRGGIWTADESRMWNDTLRPKLPDDEEARNIAEKLIREHHLLPENTTAPFRLDFGGFGATRLAIKSNTTREDHTLDTRVTYTTTLDVPERGSFRVVGGGGEFQVVLGDGGQLIGFHGVSRRADPEPLYSEVIPQKDADATFLNMTKQMKLVGYNSSLAYYLAPAFTKQDFLYPVYVYQGTIRVDGASEPIPMRVVTIPATQFGPAPPISPPQPTRSRPPQTTSTPKGRPLTRRDAREFGTSWIGTSGGLALAATNVQGVINELTADGWQMGFNWGDQNAWESDWNRNDDSYVDAVDFVFYTGHANGNGWMLSPPDDGFLDSTEVAGPLDHWGMQDCEWIVIASSGPLQDDLNNPAWPSSSGTGDSFRWAPVFDGLHILFGYASVTFDVADEGGRFIRYAKGGQRLIDAWLRTGQEVQPYNNGFPYPNGPKTWVGAMWAVSTVEDPIRNDHLWGHGTVAADPIPDTLWASMWTTC